MPCCEKLGLARGIHLSAAAAFADANDVFGLSIVAVADLDARAHGPIVKVDLMPVDTAVSTPLATIFFEARYSEARRTFQEMQAAGFLAADPSVKVRCSWR